MPPKKTSTPKELLIKQLNTLVDSIVSTETGEEAPVSKRFRKDLDNAIKKLATMAADYDPITIPTTIFDPTNPNTAGRIAALTLVAQKRYPLSNIPEFYGSGVYAIYYNGKKTGPYKQISGKDHPIYVGKADPADQASKDAKSQGDKLSKRLKEHGKSISNANATLDVKDFECRFLIVQTGFQKTAEDYLINFFKPIWNWETNICHGIGKHGDAAKTRGNKRSPWDTMHPGRKWADETVEDQKSKEEISKEIANHFKQNKPYSDIHQVFDKIMADMRQLDIG